MKKNILLITSCLIIAPTTQASVKTMYHKLYNRVVDTFQGTKCQRYKHKHPLLMSELFSTAHPILQAASKGNTIVSFQTAPEGSQEFAKISGKTGFQITTITKKNQPLTSQQKDTTASMLGKALSAVIHKRNCAIPSHFHCQVSNLFELTHGLGKAKYGHTVQCHWV